MREFNVLPYMSYHAMRDLSRLWTFDGTHKTIVLSAGPLCERMNAEEEDRDLSLKAHTDDSDLTVNVLLGCMCCVQG